MKKILVCLLLAVLVFTGCAEKVEHVDDVSHELMGNRAITIPDETSALAKAIYEATDYTVNYAVENKLGKKPEFISFYFSSDILLSSAEKDTLISLFSCYDVEITEGLRSDLEDIQRGITVGFDSIDQRQTSDCDLTIPINIYWGNDYYTYCCDFKSVKGEYVLFRFEFLHRVKYMN